MRGRSLAAAAVAVVTALGLSTTPPADAANRAAAGRGPSPAALWLARQPLAPNDGWAAAGSGTTGGSAADAAHVFVAHDRTELLAALSGDAASRIVFVSGRFSMSVDAAGRPLGCADYADPAYDLDAFLAAYDPAVWGRASKPTGPLEEARVRSAKRQGDQIKINVPANTTLIGINGARIGHGSLIVANVANVIVRNIEFTDAADCFPAWDPTDGEAGNWNSLYDLISLTGATNVWLDHNTLSDGNNHDAGQPIRLGRPYQVHDGASDIIRGSDLVTVSYNDYYDHDKTMLIGSTDTPGVDVGKLRVTVHHNRFGNVIQRAPRVRFGQVDVYNNAYTATDEEYGYSFGVGVESSIYAENNHFVRSEDLPDGEIIHYWKGTRITAIGTLVRIGSRPARPVDLVAAYNAAHDPDLTPDAGWVPTLRTRLDPTADVPRIVGASAGIRRLGI
ncbi:polysaccharide lyase family 1 protein [Actinoplanes sp. NPDC026623]|uniref:pectate lyase family protein n=1 Tax=Actinoplanes sp. NPDC026623 TaxID=3155610 RepID=UPI0033E76BCE